MLTSAGEEDEDGDDGDGDDELEEMVNMRMSAGKVVLSAS